MMNCMVIEYLRRRMDRNGNTYLAVICTLLGERRLSFCRKAQTRGEVEQALAITATWTTRGDMRWVDYEKVYVTEREVTCRNFDFETKYWRYFDADEFRKWAAMEVKNTDIPTATESAGVGNVSGLEKIGKAEG